VAVSAGFSHTSGLRKDGTAICWGSHDEGPSSSPPGAFTAIGAFYERSCGLRPDGRAVCWGFHASPPRAFA
jgi:hypothetical protein